MRVPTSKSGPTLSIGEKDLRRLIVARQGLLPGRESVGFADVDQAVCTLGSLQMDPLTIVARSHDLVLHARVPQYHPAQFADALYGRRSLFEYGGVLSAHPHTTLGFWRRHMRARQDDPRYREAIGALGDGGRRLLRLLEDHGPQTARGITERLGETPTGRSSQSSGSYRSQRIIDKALYHLWLGGRTMTHHRNQSFERVYGRTENLEPMAPLKTTVNHFLTQALHKQTVSSLSDLRAALAGALHRRVSKDECAAAIAPLVRSGAIREIEVEGKRHQFYILSTVVPTLDAIRDMDDSKDCAHWRVSLLSPLDPVVGASRRLFGYDYIWEIYKPDAKRRYGPFTMPMLYGHHLVGRIDLRTDRAGSVLIANGIWIEDSSVQSDGQFTIALRAALRRLATFVGVDSIVILGGEPTAWVTAARPILVR